ncbi:hypothetical protein P7C71_g6077, partial [Lecanoromycetidae sp. Uapishka_2]
MHFSSLQTLVTVFSLSSRIFALNIPVGVSLAAAPAVSGSNPLPPPPAPEPIGPGNYPIIDTDLKLAVQKPYGVSLPFGPTILCLASAEALLERQYAARGDVIIGDNFVYQYQRIEVKITAIYKRLMTLTKASASLASIVRIMNDYPEVGAKAITVILSEDGYGILAKIEIFSTPPNMATNVTIALNGTTPIAAIPSSLAALNPKNYRVPNTAVTIALEGQP